MCHPTPPNPSSHQAQFSQHRHLTLPSLSPWPPSLPPSPPRLSTNDGLLTDLDAYQLIKERVAKRAADNKEKGKKAEKGGEVRSQKTLTKNRDWIEKEVRREGGREGRKGRRGGANDTVSFDNHLPYFLSSLFSINRS